MVVMGWETNTCFTTFGSKAFFPGMMHGKNQTYCWEGVKAGQATGFEGQSKDEGAHIV